MITFLPLLLAAAFSGMLTVTILVLVAGFVCLIISAMGKCPVWIPVLLLYVAVLLLVLPK
jgi:hypothetical protein